MAKLTFLLWSVVCCVLAFAGIEAKALQKPGYDCVKGGKFIFEKTEWSCEKYCPGFPGCLEQCCKKRNKKIPKVEPKKPAKRPSDRPKEKAKGGTKKTGKATSKLLAIPTIAVVLLAVAGIFLLTKKLVNKMHTRRMRDALALHSDGGTEVAPLKEDIEKSQNASDSRSIGDDESAQVRQVTETIQIEDTEQPKETTNQLDLEAGENDTSICTQVEDGENNHYEALLQQRGHSHTQGASAYNDMKSAVVGVVETSM